MLPTAHRMRRSPDFTLAMRGRRAGSRSLVVHWGRGPDDEADEPALAGFVVSRAVGDAVTRNRVKRRLRAGVAARLGEVPAGSRLVVRALPPSAASTWQQLTEELDRGLTRVLSDRRG